MKPTSLHRLAVALLVAAFFPAATAKDGEVRLRTADSDTFIQVEGDEDEDWRIQSSGDPMTWSNLMALGTLLSGETNPPMRSLGSWTNAQGFCRALKTGGLFDPTLLRTINLTFTQTNEFDLMRPTPGLAND